MTHLLLAHRQADETDALDGLAAEQPQLLLHGFLHNGLERGHELVVVRHKLLLGCVGHRGNGGHHLLQHQLGSLEHELERAKEHTDTHTRQGEENGRSELEDVPMATTRALPPAA